MAIRAQVDGTFLAVLALTGPGTLFPIALAIGAGVAAVSGLAGALAGSVIGKANS